MSITTTTTIIITDPKLMEAYVPAAGTRALSLGGRSLLYAEDQQQLLELNAAADRIWTSFVTTGAVPAAVRDLIALGLPARRARALVENAAREWTLAGYVVPQALDELLDGHRGADRTVALENLAVDIRLQGLGLEELDAVFGALYGEAAGRRCRLTLIEHAGTVLFYLERRLLMAGGRTGWIAHLKAVLTDLYLDAVENGFLTHAALLLKNQRRLLLSGEPGAGKTTLALALVAAGWRYGGDDIVHVAPDGAVRGAPFAAAVKRGSLPLLAEPWPQLARLPAWIRSDGQEVRYLLPPEIADEPAGPPDFLVTLARSPGADVRIRPLPAVDALSAVVGAAYARRWRMNAEAFCALARTIERTTCAQLEYDNLAPAVGAIEEIAGVEAEAA